MSLWVLGLLKFSLWKLGLRMLAAFSSSSSTVRGRRLPQWGSGVQNRKAFCGARTKYCPISRVKLNLLDCTLWPWFIVLAKSIKASMWHYMPIFSSAVLSPRSSAVIIIFTVMLGGPNKVYNFMRCCDCCQPHRYCLIWVCHFNKSSLMKLWVQLCSRKKGQLDTKFCATPTGLQLKGWS